MEEVRHNRETSPAVAILQMNSKANTTTPFPQRRPEGNSREKKKKKDAAADHAGMMM